MAYPAYKPSGVSWLGEIPEHWEVRRLKYSASINDEALPETTYPDFEFTYVDIGRVDASKGIVATETYRFEDAPSRARRIVRQGDTIVSTVRTYLRAIAAIRKPAKNLIVSTGFAVVRPRSLDPGYLSYALRSPFFVETVVSRSTGVSYPAINAPEVGNIGVTLPPLDEQKAIAAFLDRETARIDALIEKKRRQIELLQEKRSALISHAVTKGLDPDAPMKDSGIEWLGMVPSHWEVKRAKGLLARNDGGVWGEDFDDDGVIVLRSTEQTVNGDWRIVDPAKRRLTATEYTSCRLRKGDLVVTKSSGSSLHIGKTSIVTAEVEDLNCCYSNFMQRLRANRYAQPRFIWYVLNGEVGRKQFDYYSSTTTGLANLNGSIIGNVAMAAPPLSEQKTIAAFLDRETARIDAMTATVETSIETIQEFRTALISAAVTGKIDVRGEVA